MCQVTAEEVCGCPLVTNVFEETKGICKVAKRRCNKHFCWEKCRRAQIDMERVRQVKFTTNPRVGILKYEMHSLVFTMPYNKQDK